MAAAASFDIVSTSTAGTEERVDKRSARSRHATTERHEDRGSVATQSCRSTASSTLQRCATSSSRRSCGAAVAQDPRLGEEGEPPRARAQVAKLRRGIPDDSSQKCEADSGRVHEVTPQIRETRSASRPRAGRPCIGDPGAEGRGEDGRAPVVTTGSGCFLSRIPRHPSRSCSLDRVARRRARPQRPRIHIVTSCCSKKRVDSTGWTHAPAAGLKRGGDATRPTWSWSTLRLPRGGTGRVGGAIEELVAPRARAGRDRRCACRRWETQAADIRAASPRLNDAGVVQDREVVGDLFGDERQTEVAGCEGC
jgi:hypothetical protein